MSGKRRKQHQPGERLSVYLNKDLPPHFFDWLNKQDDVSAFVLYALQDLYAKTGDINLSEELPRRFHFKGAENEELPHNMDTPKQVHVQVEPVAQDKPVTHSIDLADSIEFEEEGSHSFTDSIENQDNEKSYPTRGSSTNLTNQYTQTKEPSSTTTTTTTTAEEAPESKGKWAGTDDVVYDY